MLGKLMSVVVHITYKATFSLLYVMKNWDIVIFYFSVLACKSEVAS